MFEDEFSGMYDGVHMYSGRGKEVFTESIANIIISSLNGEQTEKQQQQQQQLQVEENLLIDIPLKNRFSPLGN